MPEEIFVHFKFKNRKTGEFKDGFFKIPNIENYATGLKKYFNIHEFRICEKRLISKEEYDKHGKV